jgi:hypothetical protein
MVCSIKEMQGSELQSMYFLQIHPQLADGHVSELFVPILQPRSQLLKLSHQFASLIIPPLDRSPKLRSMRWQFTTDRSNELRTWRFNSICSCGDPVNRRRARTARVGNKRRNTAGPNIMFLPVFSGPSGSVSPRSGA